MKQGKTLTELATEIERRRDLKSDYLADTKQLSIVPVQKAIGSDVGKFDVNLEVNGIGAFDMDNNTHGQIAAHLKIPKKYYDRCLQEAPTLLAGNVNHWLHENPARRMVRTLDGRTRAFLSDRYRVIDHEEVLEYVLPVMAGLEVKFQSCEVTERKLYLKATFPTIREEVKVGDIVESGVMVSNSEVGLGAVNVDPFIYRLSCKNGARMSDFGMKKYHVGRVHGMIEGREAHELFRDDTLRADDRAFLLKLRDVIRAAADEVMFKSMVDKLREATENKIERDVVEVVEVTQKKFGMNDGERSSVLTHLIREGDLSQYGLGNAITRASQDIEDYDRATEFERFGGEVFELPKSEWKTIAVEKAA